MSKFITPLIFIILPFITTAIYIEVDQAKLATVQYRQPTVFTFLGGSFPENSSVVIVRLTLKPDSDVTSGLETGKPLHDTNCVIVSVQNETKESVLKDEENVRFRGLWHTMTSRGAVTLQRSSYPNGFHIVLVADTSETTCEGNTWQAEPRPSKKIEVIVSNAMEDHVYWTGLFLPLGISALIILVTIICGCIMSRWLDYRQVSYGPATEWECSKSCTDFLRELFTPETPLSIANLTNRTAQLLEKRSKLYLGTVLPVGVYYVLPTIQLVIMYLYHTDETGNLDMCYYNFECAYPTKVLWWVIKDFNHVLSNVGYICAGISAFVWISVVSPKTLKTRPDRNGIPPHSGLDYAIAFAITVEGVLSACYHICPNRSNFHHDTCFMYICVTLTGLKLYQARHPQSSVSGPTTFVLLGILMFFELLGEKLEYHWFFWTFSFLHLLGFLALATQMFYLGKTTLCSKKVLYKIGRMLRNKPEDTENGATRDVYVWIWVAFLANLGVVFKFYFVDFRPAINIGETFDFGTYVLIILAVNMILYFAYYLVMKWAYNEKFSWIFCMLFIPALVLWGWGGYYFGDTLTAWERPAPISRELNRACKFYDEHDLWHFLSAGALFLTFMSLEFLDIELLDTPHNEIPVF